MRLGTGQREWAIPLAVVGVGVAISVPRFILLSQGQPLTTSEWSMAAIGVVIGLVGLTRLVQQMWPGHREP
jgi:hypothetical protein